MDNFSVIVFRLKFVEKSPLHSPLNQPRRTHTSDQRQLARGLKTREKVENVLHNLIQKRCSLNGYHFLRCILTIFRSYRVVHNRGFKKIASYIHS